MFAILLSDISKCLADQAAIVDFVRKDILKILKRKRINKFFTKLNLQMRAFPKIACHCCLKSESKSKRIIFLFYKFVLRFSLKSINKHKFIYPLWSKLN